MKTKQIYENPLIETFVLTKSDIITTSGFFGEEIPVNNSVNSTNTDYGTNGLETNSSDW